MHGSSTIFINKGDCTGCWRCIRECPVKAISVKEGAAEVRPEKCVACGQCLGMCRFGAVRLREDIYPVRELIKKYEVKVASVTPQWVTEMEGYTEASLVEALRLLGFTHVSETALAAGVCLAAETDAARDRTIVSARCPAVVSYIAKYAPKHTGLLSPVASPMIVHARMIRKRWGAGVKIVHFTACPAAKHEAGQTGSGVDAVITFHELRKWLRDEGIESGNLFGQDRAGFEPYGTTAGMLYNLCGEGGANFPGVETHSVSTLSGIGRQLKVFRDAAGQGLLIDAMACGGGCTGSCITSTRAPSPIRQASILREKAAERDTEESSRGFPTADVCHFAGEPRKSTEADTGRPYPLPKVPEGFVAESDTLLALDELGMTTRAMQTDCNACGYGTCRRFAKALSRGEVNREICWFYLRSEVTTKFTTLLSRLSSGVAIVGSSMRVEQANRLFATMMGPAATAVFDSGEGLAGRNAAEVMPFYRLVSSVLESGEESVVRDIQIGERLITVSVHTVQKNRSVIVICRNMIFSQVRNEEIVGRTQRVINENLETVRKIASLLGENASRTEAILNSILEAHTGRQ